MWPRLSGCAAVGDRVNVTGSNDGAAHRIDDAHIVIGARSLCAQRRDGLCRVLARKGRLWHPTLMPHMQPGLQPLRCRVSVWDRVQGVFTR